jgi:hypothetical protein
VRAASRAWTSARAKLWERYRSDIDIDVIVDADTAQTPFGRHVRLDRQWVERSRLICRRNTPSDGSALPR